MKKAHTVTLFSKAEMTKKGYKKRLHSDELYLGSDSKYPLDTVSALHDSIYGKTLEVTRVKRHDGKIIRYFVENEYGDEVSLNLNVIKSKPKLATPKYFNTEAGRAIYDGLSFTFPCNYSDLRPVAARDLAKWIIKCVGNK